MASHIYDNNNFLSEQGWDWQREWILLTWNRKIWNMNGRDSNSFNLYVQSTCTLAARAIKIIPVADAMFWSSAMSPNINGVWVGTWHMTGFGMQVGFKFKRNLSMWEFFIKTDLEMIFWNSIFLLQILHLDFLELFNGSKTRPLSDPTTYKRKGQSIFEYANWPRLQI